MADTVQAHPQSWFICSALINRPVSSSPTTGVIPYVISLCHIFALLVILNRFSRLTSGGAKKEKKREGKRQIEKEPKVVGEADRDRCVESKRERPELEK